MLVRKENEIEIWTDVPQKGQAKYCFIASFIVAVILLLLFLIFDSDYTIKETYYAMMFWVGMPTSLFIIAGLINLKNEKRKPELVVKVNPNYIEIRKKETKQIDLKQITKVNIVSSQYGGCIVIFYKEEDVEKKHSFLISPVNRGLVKVALKEFKKDILIDNI